MEQKRSKKDLFMAILLTMIPMILWGSLYPFIKIGYEAFAINSASIPDIIVFASMRFTVCGAIVCAIAMIRRDKIEAPRLKSVGSILLIGLFSIVLHYAFTYIGLSLGDSSKTALLKQLGALLYLCTAPIFIKDERFNKFKLIGSLIGFGGIIAINFGTDFSAIAIGDIVIVLASICSVISMILTKRIANNTSAFWATGISQLGGGLVLLTAGLITGGRIPQINAKAVLVFAYICVASIVAYVTFFYCQRKFATSKLLIIKFTEPLFACIFGALLLGEEIFKLNYLIAFILICLGIAIGNIRSRKSEYTQMKAQIFEIKRFAVHDGDGIRTTVFFKGCPLRCAWCHNPEGIGFKRQLAYYEHKCVGCGECAKVCPTGAHSLCDGKHVFDREKCIGCGKCTKVCPASALTLYGNEVTVDELLPALLEDKDFYDNSGGGVTLSGGECLMQADFCAQLLKKLKAEGISTAVDTCGFVKSSELDKVIPYTDVFLYDLKAYDGGVHKLCTAQDNSLILENLRYLDSRGAKIEVRIPYVPGFNSTQIPAIAKLLSELNNLTKVRVLPYHSYAGSKYSALGMKNTLPETLPTNEELAAARAEIAAYGIKVME